MPTNVFQDLFSALTRTDFRPRAVLSRSELTATTRKLRANCERLLANDGQASSVHLASSIFDLYTALPGAAAQRAFLMCLRNDFGADRKQIKRCYQAYEKNADDEAVQHLYEACEPRRREVLRRLNLAPGGTLELVHMRQDLLSMLDDDPQLQAVDYDFERLFGSWFNHGFLVLRQIDWHTSAAVLEKLIEREAVHEIRDWQDLQRRLDPRDRRCFAFFHPALGDEPLIFVEVALTQTIPDCSEDLTQGEPQIGTPEAARTAAFFGISNCQPGLHGISFGDFLLKHVVRELQRELPDLNTFVTVSPVPGFARWLRQFRRDDTAEPDIPGDQKACLASLDKPAWHTDLSEQDLAQLRDLVLPLAAWYLSKAKNNLGLPLDPVARFHLRNGARLERINWLGDSSDKNLQSANGLMVNYVYDVKQIEANHERLMSRKSVAQSREIRRLLRQLTRQTEDTQQQITS